jgi:hypothetical protein
MAVMSIETREGWPMLTMKLKLWQIGTQGVRLHMKGVISCLICWARRAGTRDFGPVLAPLVGPVQNTLFLTVHYFTTFVSIIQHAE